MKPKSLGVAAAAAILIAGFGLAVQKLRKPPEAAARTGEHLFPDLLDRINSVASVSVTTPNGAYHIVRKDGRWGLAEKGGYPVESGPVSKAILGFADLETVEPKTSDPARYVDIGVQDTTAEGAKSKQVSLRDDKDAEIASLIVGERRSGRGEPSYFVRKPGEAQSWLVRGDLEVKENANDWLDKKILEIKRNDVRAVQTVQPDGESLLISKKKRDDVSFDVHDVPPDRELKYATVASGMGGALEYLNLEDVLPAADFQAPEGEPVRTSYWTFDGLRVDVSIYDKDAKTYARFHASYDPEGPPGAELVGPAAPGEDAQPADENGEEGEPGEDAQPEEPKAPETRPAEDVKADAQKLDERLSSWVFEIPPYTKTNFTKRMSDMLKELEPPKPPAGEGAAPDAGGGADAMPVDEGSADETSTDPGGEDGASPDGGAKDAPAPEGGAAPSPESGGDPKADGAPESSDSTPGGDAPAGGDAPKETPGGG